MTCREVGKLRFLSAGTATSSGIFAREVEIVFFSKLVIAVGVENDWGDCAGLSG